MIYSMRIFPMLWLVLLASVPLSGAAQDPAPDRATIQALLAEVRQLRIALERSTIVLPRLQLAFQRLQAQQDRVDRLSRELRDVRNHIANQAAEGEHAASVKKQLEEMIDQTQDPNRRKQIEAQIRSIAMDRERATAQEQQARLQEGELASQLQSEQAKLAELSEQAAALEKKLQEARPAALQ